MAAVEQSPWCALRLPDNRNTNRPHALKYGLEELVAEKAFGIYNASRRDRVNPLHSLTSVADPVIINRFRSWPTNS